MDAIKHGNRQSQIEIFEIKLYPLLSYLKPYIRVHKKSYLEGRKRLTYLERIW